MTLPRILTHFYVAQKSISDVLSLCVTVPSIYLSCLDGLLLSLMAGDDAIAKPRVLWADAAAGGNEMVTIAQIATTKSVVRRMKSTKRYVCSHL